MGTRSALALVALVSVAACGTGQRPAADDARSKLQAAAKRFAEVNNGKAVHAEAVKSTRAVAEKATSGAGVSGDEAVWVLQVEGDFTCTLCHGPTRKTGPITGHYLIAVINPETWEDFSAGYKAERTDLAALGEVIDVTP